MGHDELSSLSDQPTTEGVTGPTTIGTHGKLATGYRYTRKAVALDLLDHP